jgi:nucleoside-diphosphate-sugar epimerase
MHVLVTGGGGYLGSWLVSLLLEAGHRVRVLDRFCFTADSLKEFADHPSLEIIRGDIRRLQECPDLFMGVEAVVHLAGLANDPSCDLDSDMTQDVNVDASVELANRAVQSGVSRFVLASSCSVYGQGVHEFLDETSPTNPVSAYAQSKLDAEEAIFAMQSATFIPVAARMATLFGWSRRMRYDLAVNQMTATAVSSNVIKVMGGGNQWRPFVHVKDAARAFVLMLDAPAPVVSGEAFNVGANDDNVQITTLAERVAAVMPA